MLKEILSRTSTRSFSEKPLSSSAINYLKTLLDKPFILPFSGTLEASYQPPESLSRESLNKTSHYGNISGKCSYISFEGNHSKESLLNIGFYLSYITLSLTKEGFATCILGGDFTSLLETKKEWIPILLCVGHQNSKRHPSSLKEDDLSLKRRKEFQEVYFQRSLDYQIKDNPSPTWKEAMDALRIAPSTRNAQPWKTIVEKNKLHYYLDVNINSSISEFKYIDAGIALHHLVYQLDALNISYQFRDIAREPLRNAEYIISIAEKNPTL